MAVLALRLHAPSTVVVILDEDLATCGADIAPLELMAAHRALVMGTTIKWNYAAAAGIA
jgi:hypothetical protein